MTTDFYYTFRYLLVKASTGKDAVSYSIFTLSLLIDSLYKMERIFYIRELYLIIHERIA
ncbi:MAG: hypothetical protein ACXWWA_12295 [Chitinophagaceae bacterium]